MHLKPGDLFAFRSGFLANKYDDSFVGVFLKIDSSGYPWHRVSFLHDSVVKNLDLLMSEISKHVEVLNEIR